MLLTEDYLKYHNNIKKYQDALQNSGHINKLKFQKVNKQNKAIANMRRKSPRPENIYFIENHCKTNISQGRR